MTPIKETHKQAKAAGSRYLSTQLTGIEPTDLSSVFEREYFEQSFKTPPQSPRTNVCPQTELVYDERSRYPNL